MKEGANSSQQLEIKKLYIKGFTAGEISRKLGIVEKCVESFKPKSEEVADIAARFNLASDNGPLTITEQLEGPKAGSKKGGKKEAAIVLDPEPAAPAINFTAQ